MTYDPADMIPGTGEAPMSVDTQHVRRIKCGNCKKHHPTVADIKHCYDVGPALEPASSSQISYAQMLWRQRMPLPNDSNVDTRAMENAINAMNKTEISEFITAYKAQSFKPQQATKMQVAVDLEDGIYVKGDKPDWDVFKVYWNLGKSRLLVKRLIVTEAPEGSTRKDGSDKEYDAEWEYVGMATAALLNGYRKAPQDEASAFGELYGICMICGRDINAGDSVKRGVGRICWEKQGW